MGLERRFPLLLNVLVIAVTIVFVALALVVGRATEAAPIVLEVGDPAPVDLVATRQIPIEDHDATERARQQARDSEPAPYTIDPTITPSVRADAAGFFAAVRNVAFDETFNPVGDVVEAPETIAPVPTTALETAEEPPAGEVPVEEQPPAVEGEEVEAAQEQTTTTTTEPPTTTTTLPRVELETQIELLESQYAIYGDAVGVFVALYNRDLDRAAEAAPPILPLAEEAVDELIDAQMSVGIRTEELSDIQTGLINSPPRFFLPGLETAERDAVEQATAQVAALSLQANEFVDQDQWLAAQERAALETPPVTVVFFEGQSIVEAGERVTDVQLEAINLLELLEPEQVTSRLAIAGLGAIAVLLTAFFLWRIAPSQWSQPRHFALLGVLLILAAAASRIPELIVPEETPELAFVLPAVMFGYVAAILYDPRTAVLVSVPVAIFTAISTESAALTIYAAAATVAPVAFVSAVSSRRELRLAVFASAIVLAPLAASVAWLFLGTDSAALAALFGFAGGIIAGLIAQGLLSFLENLFRVTTTVTLLDLTDRNHPALRLLEDHAPGTFNHSILVGNLAGRATRAIGADPLLAEAAAYYHDLGKTEHPQYFIENQFGVSNPHDELTPEQSAEILRRHVTDGLRLARQFRIPDDVADGIRMHHGTGLMRFFYHKALDTDPVADPSLYRHSGVKPRRKEMAILMLSDAVEGAARALAQHEDPTADSLRKLVDSIVGEKLEDGQLDESDLTYGDLTRVKAALVQALVGYYHTRIPYPGFPGPSTAEQPALPPADDEDEGIE